MRLRHLLVRKNGGMARSLLVWEFDSFRSAVYKRKKPSLHMNGEAAHRTCYRLLLLLPLLVATGTKSRAAPQPAAHCMLLICIGPLMPCTAAGARARHAAMPRMHACPADATPGRRGACAAQACCAAQARCAGLNSKNSAHLPLQQGA